MREDVRKYVEAAFESLNPSRARERAGQLVKGQPTEQVNRVARELVSLSQRFREWFTDLVQAEVKRQLKAAGIATRDDLDTLRARVRELERSRSGTGSRSRKSSARKSSAKRSSAKKSSAKTATRSGPSGSGSTPSGSSTSSEGFGPPGSSG